MASRRCPACREPITLRKNHAGETVLLRAEWVEGFDAGNEALLERKAMIREVGPLGVNEAGFVATESELIARRGAAAPGDVFWAIANRQARDAMRRGDWHRLSMTYWIEARRLRAEGKPYAHVGREASRAELQAFRQNGATEIEIAGGATCAVCSRDNGRHVKIATELEAPHIPHEDCPLGWCACYYAPVVMR